MMSKHHLSYSLLIICILALTSCGANKLSFVRAKTSMKQEIVRIDRNEDNRTPEVDQSTISSIQTLKNTSIEKSHLYSSPIPSGNTVELQTSEVHPAFPITKNDTVPTHTISDAQKVQIASQAERHGKRSFLFGLFTSLSILLAATIAITLWFDFTVFLVGAILALIFGVLSLIFGIKSLSSSYNTPKGRRKAIGAFFLSIPFMLIAVLIFLTTL